MVDRPGLTPRASALFIMLVTIGLGAAAASPAHAQTRDPLWNGTIVGAAVGAAAGVAFTHAVRDSDLTFGQYARGALIFGAIGAGAGAGVDALFFRRDGHSTRPVTIVPNVWSGIRAVTVRWKW